MTLPLPEPRIFGASRDPSYPCPAELLHVSIYHHGPGVEDMIRFYCVVLNMRFVFKYVYPTFEFIALSFDDENHRVGIVNNLVDRDGLAMAQQVESDAVAAADGVEPRKAPQRQCRVEHTSWRFERFEDVLAAAKRIHEELGLWPRSARHQGGGLTIDYLDPDGNRVEFVTQGSSKAQILWGLERALGPTGGIGVREYADTYASFSMAKMIALWEAGYPLEQLKDKAHCEALAAEGRL